jgi:hypothetical protein
MKINLRIADTDLGTVTNVVFKPKKHFRMALFPLPPDEWVGPQHCSACGGKPDFLQEDMKPICKKCIDTITRGLTVKEASQEPSIPVTMEVVFSSRFEWSVDGEKWYSIKGKNIKCERPDSLLKEVKKSILEKRPMVLEADYDKDTKTMSVLF